MWWSRIDGKNVIPDFSIPFKVRSIALGAIEKKLRRIALISFQLTISNQNDLHPHYPFPTSDFEKEYRTMEVNIRPVIIRSLAARSPTGAEQQGEPEWIFLNSDRNEVKIPILSELLPSHFRLSIKARSTTIKATTEPSYHPEIGLIHVG